jgi:TPR repeat protein
VPKSLPTAAYYFEVSATLGDADSMNDLAFCYLHGHGVKKDLFKAAKFYRMAENKGQGLVGNSWIWKEKYNDKEEIDQQK